MKNKRFHRILGLLTAIAMLVGCIGVLSACAPQRKAIIIVPGIMGSGLGITDDDGTFNAVWDPFGDVSIDSLMTADGDFDVVAMLPLASTIYEILAGLGNDDTDIFKIMSLDEDGVPLRDDLKPADFFGESEVLKYGTLGVYKQMYDSLEAEYGDEYDVVVYNYDWRCSVTDAAEGLEAMIKEQRYSSVSLLAHSLGGLVVSNYAGSSAENAEKIDLFVSLGTPFYGSITGMSAPTDPFYYLGMDDAAAAELPFGLGDLGADFQAVMSNMPGIQSMWAKYADVDH